MKPNEDEARHVGWPLPQVRLLLVFCGSPPAAAGFSAAGKELPPRLRLLRITPLVARFVPSSFFFVLRFLFSVCFACPHAMHTGVRRACVVLGRPTPPSRLLCLCDEGGLHPLRRLLGLRGN